MLYSYFEKNVFARFVILSISYIALAWITFVFYVHGVKGIQIAETFVQITNALRLPVEITEKLVVLVGIADLVVVVLLVIHPRWWVLAWTAIWPWVPYALVQYAGGSTGIAEFALVSGAAVIAFITRPPQTPLQYIKRFLVEKKRSNAKRDL